MSSGVAVCDQVKKCFQDEIKKDRKYRYAIFAINAAGDMIEVIKRAPRDATYEDFVEELRDAEENKKQARFAIMDFPVTINSQDQTKLLLFHWSPDTLPMKQKMWYASSKDAFKKALGEGVAKEIQANDLSDLNKNEITQEIIKAARN